MPIKISVQMQPLIAVLSWYVNTETCTLCPFK